MTDRHFYEPVAGHRLRHDPFNAIVGPRPIGWISSRGADGSVNLAPYSFFNAFNYLPPIVGFASTGWKDSVRNISETKEFVWNLVTRGQAEAMNATSASVAPGIDEFGLAGLDPMPAQIVAPPLVAGAPVSFECRLSQLVQLVSATGQPIDTWLVLGEVVGVHIDPDLIRDGVYDTAAAQPILRGGGIGDYFSVSPDQKFVMRRPA